MHSPFPHLSRFLLTRFLAVLVALSHICPASADDPWSLEVLQPGPAVSLRGLDAPSPRIAWACGSKGTILRSDGDWKRWKDVSVSEWKDLEFRSIHALDDKTACVASAGSPAIILHTTDGGSSWNEVYRHPSPQAFFDGFTFWDPLNGMAISDPVDGHWLILITHDGGLHWKEMQPPLQAQAGEAAFAASSGSLFATDTNHAWLATGGKTSEPNSACYRFHDQRWSRFSVPIPTSESAGLFAILSENNLTLAVGGDYQQEAIGAASAAWSHDQGQTWSLASTMPSGFRSSLAKIDTPDGPQWLCAGPNGIDHSLDGINWTPISSTGFHTLRAVENRILAAGSKGRIGILCRP